MAESYSVIAERYIKLGKQLGLTKKALQKYVAENARHEEEKAREEAEKEREEDGRKRAHELELARIHASNVQLQQPPVVTVMNGPMNKPAPFDGSTDIEAFLLQFELTIAQQEKDISKWPAILISCNQGKALSMLQMLKPEERSNYVLLKKAVITMLGKSEDTYRKLFHEVRPEYDTDLRQFIGKVKTFLENWLQLSGINRDNPDEIIDLFVVDKVPRMASPELFHFLKERKVCTEAALIDGLDTFRDAYPDLPLCRSASPEVVAAMTSRRYRSPPTTSYQQRCEPRACYVCGSLDHIARNCRSAARTPRGNSVTFQQPQAYYAGAEGRRTRSPSPVRSRRTDVTSSPVGAVLSPRGKLIFFPALVNNSVAELLRDTGAVNVVVMRELVARNQFLPFDEEVILADGSRKRFPTAHIDIETPFISGSVRATVMDNPVADIILGNLPDIRDCTKEQIRHWINEKDIYRWPCFKSQIKRHEIAHVQLGQHIEEDVGGGGHTPVALVQTRAKNYRENDPVDKQECTLPDFNPTPEEFRIQQANDETIRELFKTTRMQTGDQQPYFEIKNHYLTRFIPTSGKRQLVVPKLYRHPILLRCHSLPLAGHMAVRKTCQRIKQHFYWPNMAKDVSTFVKACKTCQRVNRIGSNHFAPLQKMDNHFDTVPVPGKQNAVADILSKLIN